MFQTLKYIPAKIWVIEGEVVGILFFMLAGAVLFVIPFINRSPEKHPRRNMVFTLFGVIALLFIVVMTIVGYLA
jgi:quinol-cytochrome oxidoreductase complex cytochrome b subunit